ncbi:hypothetical protein GCM10020331_026290 [Ectobacillus funiculus]
MPLCFWIWYREPHEDKRLTKEEYQYITEGGSQSSKEASGSTMKKNMRYLLTKRKVWAVFIGFASYGYSWFFYSSPGFQGTLQQKWACQY